MSTTPRDLQQIIAAEREGLPFLVFRDGEGAQRVVILDGSDTRLTLGRREGNTIALPWDDEVSRVHAELESIADEWTVVDDGLSTNGTFLNTRRIRGRQRLRDRDEVRVGRTTIVFRAPDEDEGRTNVGEDRPPMASAISDTQRRILVALCRPVRDRPGALPATNKAIAEEVHLSVDAVKTHLRTLARRFGIGDLPQNEKRVRLVELAERWGLVSENEP